MTTIVNNRLPAVPPNRFKVSTSDRTRTRTAIKDREANAPLYPEEPTVFYTPEVFHKMNIIVDHCKEEVGWMGIVEKLANGDFRIIDIFVPEQEVCATETDIDSEALAKLAEELIERDIDTDMMFAWYHSHVNMGVTPSGQDETQVEEFLETCPIFIRGIVNKKGDAKVDVYYRDHGIAYTCVPTRVEIPSLADGVKEELIATLDANVKEAPRRVPGFPNYNQDYWNDYDDIGNWQGAGTNRTFTPPPYQGFRFNNAIEPRESKVRPFGTSWTLTTPLNQRPYQWFLDFDYVDQGVYEFDSMLWTQAMDINGGVKPEFAHVILFLKTWTGSTIIDDGEEENDEEDIHEAVAHLFEDQ